jgi:hypothetical protein
VRDSSAIEEERDGTSSLRTRLEVIDDQRRLFLTVNVKTCTLAADVNLDLGPRVRHEVYVRFVLGRVLLAQTKPWPIGV